MTSQGATTEKLGDENAPSDLFVPLLDEDGKQGDDNTADEGSLFRSLQDAPEDSVSSVHGGTAPGDDNDNGQIQASKERNLGESSPVLPDVGESVVFLQDDVRDMTNSRRIALFLMRFKFYYNPEAVQRAERSKWESIKASTGELGGVEADETKTKNPSPPSLENGWAYFEHATLPRYLVSCEPTEEEREDDQGEEDKPFLDRIVKCLREYLDPRVGEKLDRAEAGEHSRPTKLYSVFFTPVNQLGDFGLGVGLYYSTLRGLVYLMLIVGLVNIPNLRYYSSTEYSKYGQDSQDMDSLIRGSAICTDQPFVPCVDCSFAQYKDAEERLATIATPVPSNETFTIFAQRNACNGATSAQVMVNYASLFIVLVGIWMMDLYHKKMETLLDENDQTAQDYSIAVLNPPRDAFSAEEWKDFFAQMNGGAHVTTCTVAVNNSNLLRLLIERRECLQQIEFELPVGYPLDMDSLERMVVHIEQKSPIPSLYHRVVALNEQIREVAAGEFHVNRVFVTFEREEDQRYVLNELWHKKNRRSHDQNSSSENVDKLFRGTHTVKVREAGEPSEIRWQYLDQSVKSRVIEIAISIAALFSSVVVLAYVVRILRRIPSSFTALVIAVFNILFPKLAQAMSKYETHPTEGQRQRSLFIKIAIFRMLNTAIVIRFAMPFTSTITPGDNHLISRVYSIFWAEIVTSNVIQCLDIGGFVKKCCKAPKAATQEQMNLHFRGSTYDLAERYTNTTKILFFVFVYAVVFPAGFFFGAVFFAVTYYVDKLSLMRTWRQGPEVGKQTPDFCRKYAIPINILSLVMCSSYAWTGFPYDNLCDSGTRVAETGSYPVHPQGDDSSPVKTVDVMEGDTVYKHCNQQLFIPHNGVVRFPALPSYQPPGSRWMTNEQEWGTNIYGWTSVAFLIAVIVFIAWRIFKDLKLWKSEYKATGRVMGANYSDVPHIDAYIPEVSSEAFSFPFLACNIDDIDESLVGWTDPGKPYEYYNLARDLDLICEGTDISPNAFGQIKHWPPPKEFRSGTTVNDGSEKRNPVARN